MGITSAPASLELTLRISTNNGKRPRLSENVRTYVAQNLENSVIMPISLTPDLNVTCLWKM